MTLVKAKCMSSKTPTTKGQIGGYNPLTERFSIANFKVAYNKHTDLQFSQECSGPHKLLVCHKLNLQEETL